MQKYLIFIFAFFIVLTGYAQSPITISASNAGTNNATTIHYHVANISGVKAPLPGNNKVWDYSGFSGGSLRSINIINEPSYSPSAIADTNGFETISGSYGLVVSSVYDEDLKGYFFAGNIIRPQSFSLFSVTNNPTDSIFIPTQYYKLRQNYLSFPMTAGTRWVTNNVHDINFNITASAYFLHKTPAKKREHIIVVDSVAGWGTLSVPSPNKASKAYPVLMVERHTKTIDSFFMSGSPAPPLLLNSFSLKQGDTTDTYQEFFYREGSIRPLLTYDFGPDDTYSVPDGATYDADNVVSGVPIPVFQMQEFDLYPNPVGPGRIIHLKLDKTSIQSWQCTIENALGQVVNTFDISGFGPVDFQADLSGVNPGLYFVSVRDSNGSLIGTTRLNLLK